MQTLKQRVSVLSPSPKSVTCAPAHSSGAAGSIGMQRRMCDVRHTTCRETYNHSRIGHRAWLNSLTPARAVPPRRNRENRCVTALNYVHLLRAASCAFHVAATLHGWQCTDTDTMRPAEHALVLSFLLTPRAVAARRFASAYLEADVLVKPAEHQRRFPLQIHLAHTASEEEKRECSTKCAGYKSNPPALSRMSTNLHGAVGESTRRQRKVRM